MMERYDSWDAMVAEIEAAGHKAYDPAPAWHFPNILKASVRLHGNRACWGHAVWDKDSGYGYWSAVSTSVSYEDAAIILSSMVRRREETD